jgi:2'-5' RNA ligase
MDLDAIERERRLPQEKKPPVFALVIYIPGELGEFLDELRLELVPGCNPHAHVSLLPPRPLTVNWRVASEQVREVMDRSTPFEVELTGIQMFPATDVIYIEVGAGAGELRKLHAAMNADGLQFRDPFPYHPHITLAQELLHENVAGVHELATRRWREYSGSRTFPAAEAVFVQNSLDNCWIDLAAYSLGGSPVKS